MTARACRPLGFVLLMLGFGLRLDSDWQVLAWLLLLGGAAMAALGLRPGGRAATSAGAFVPPRSEG